MYFLPEILSLQWPPDEFSQCLSAPYTAYLGKNSVVIEINSKMLIVSSGDRILPWMKNYISTQTKVLSLGQENRENISETHIKSMKDIANTS